MVSGFKIGVAMKKGNEDLLKALFDALTVLQADGTQKRSDKRKLIQRSSLPIAIQR